MIYRRTGHSSLVPGSRLWFSYARCRQRVRIVSAAKGQASLFHLLRALGRNPDVTFLLGLTLAVGYSKPISIASELRRNTVLSAVLRRIERGHSARAQLRVLCFLTLPCSRCRSWRHQDCLGHWTRTGIVRKPTRTCPPPFDPAKAISWPSSIRMTAPREERSKHSRPPPCWKSSGSGQAPIGGHRAPRRTQTMTVYKTLGAQGLGRRGGGWPGRREGSQKAPRHTQLKQEHSRSLNEAVRVTKENIKQTVIGMVSRISKKIQKRLPKEKFGPLDSHRPRWAPIISDPRKGAAGSQFEASVQASWLRNTLGISLAARFGDQTGPFASGEVRSTQPCSGLAFRPTVTRGEIFARLVPILREG